MPLELPLKEMERVIKEGYSCAECGGRLNIATYKGHLVLRCGNIEHNTITRHDKEYEERIGRYRMKSTALTAMTQQQMLIRVAQAKFPTQLTRPEMEILAMIARERGFDPVFGEISLFQGKPYITIDGRRRKAQETGQLDGSNTIPATAEERKAQQIQDGDFLWKCEVWVKGSAHPFIGWGRVTQAQIEKAKAQAKARNHQEDSLPIVKDPNGQAEVRAEHKALRKAFHIDLPGLEEIGSDEEADYIESTAKVVEEKTEDPPDPPATFNFGAVLAWCYSHGTQYNKTWFLEHCGMRESDIQDDLPKLEYAMSNICTLMNWDGIKRG